MAKRMLMVITEAAEADLTSAARSAAALARESGGLVRMVDVRPIPPRRVDHYDHVVADTDREMARLTDVADGRMVALAWEFTDVPVERVVRFGRLAAELAIEVQTFDADLVGLVAPTRPSLRDRLRAWYLGRSVPTPVVLLPLAPPAGDRRDEAVVLPAFR